MKTLITAAITASTLALSASAIADPGSPESGCHGYYTTLYKEQAQDRGAQAPRSAVVETRTVTRRMVRHIRSLDVARRFRSSSPHTVASDPRHLVPRRNLMRPPRRATAMPVRDARNEARVASARGATCAALSEFQVRALRGATTFVSNATRAQGNSVGFALPWSADCGVSCRRRALGT